jgi:hypothetical protein
VLGGAGGYSQEGVRALVELALSDFRRRSLAELSLPMYGAHPERDGDWNVDDGYSTLPDKAASGPSPYTFHNSLQCI